MPDFRARK
jgi:hypothetical protein